MEKIIYRLTLDTHRNGIQKTLQGFETSDKIARRIAISLVSGSDSYEIDKDVVAMMYVTTPNATEPSVNSCTIEGNTIIYDVLPIVEEGITEMQMKLIGVGNDGAESVLVSPKFTVEVTESGTIDGGEQQTVTFTALDEAIAKAEVVYNQRLLNIEIDDDCVFRAYYADGTVYENNEVQTEVHEYIDEVMEEHLESINISVRNAKNSEENAKLSETNTKLSEKNVKLSEVNAKHSEDNAKLSEANAKKYMEEAFLVTPEGYEKFMKDASSVGIKASTDFIISDTKNGGLKLVELCGNTEKVEQDGITSLESVGKYDEEKGMYVVPIIAHTKNLMKNKLFSMVFEGVRFTRYEDGSVTVKGTNTADIPSGMMVTSQKYLSLKRGSYILSGAPKGSSYRDCWLDMVGYDVNDTREKAYDYGDGVTFDFTNEGGSYNISVMVAPGATVDATFYPMIRNADETDDAYEPYGESIANIYLDAPLRKVGDFADRIRVKDGEIGVERNVLEIASYNGETINTEYISTTDSLSTGATVQYVSERSVFTAFNEENLISIYGLKTHFPNTRIDVDTSVKPSGVKAEYSTGEVGAMILENSNICAINKIEIDILKSSITQ
jgi:hypothetical protein